MKMKTWKKAMLILLMLALSLIFVSPILLLLNSSFKELKEIYAYERILGQEKLLVACNLQEKLWIWKFLRNSLKSQQNC